MSTMSVVVGQRNVYHVCGFEQSHYGNDELMTCCSCDKSPGPRLLAPAAGAVGVCRSATGQTQRRKDGVYFGRWFGAGHPVCSPTNLNTPPPPSSHTHSLSPTHTQPGRFYLVT
ncbi:Hypothetical predicted protein [Scomber scombrus]|uniref:Uncharacterized protein n=1 Tax=Scomber scombrus TaxID=13677 RepID=A0AAV1Q5K2_SCOSC